MLFRSPGGASPPPSPHAPPQIGAERGEFRGISRVSAPRGREGVPWFGRGVARLCASAPDWRRLPRLMPRPLRPLRPRGLRSARALAARLARARAAGSARLALRVDADGVRVRAACSGYCVVLSHACSCSVYFRRRYAKRLRPAESSAAFVSRDDGESAESRRIDSAFAVRDGQAASAAGMPVGVLPEMPAPGAAVAEVEHGVKLRVFRDFRLPPKRVDVLEWWRVAHCLFVSFSFLSCAC